VAGHRHHRLVQTLRALTAARTISVMTVSLEELADELGDNVDHARAVRARFE
jgi:hypothetical protein